jgi:aryl-alcohol dehydrogenase-like predicted oxidoreductase
MYQTTIKTTELGQTGLEITRVGFGAWAVGGGNWEFGWGPQDDDESIGVSNFDVEQLRRIQQIAPVESLQPQYSLIERDVEPATLPFAERERIGVIAYSPMGSGMLTGGMTRERVERLPEDDWRKHDARFNEPQLSRNLDLVTRLTAVADRYDTTPGAIAVAWTLRNRAVDGAIVGFRRPDQVDPILPAASIDLTPQDIAEIEGSTR